MSRLLIRNAHIVDSQTDILNGWLTVESGMITAIGEGDYNRDIEDFTEIIEAKGRLLMPGVIDEHVHFREPGLTSKADIASESAAAAAGGVTTFFDMPNTAPATISEDAWKEKVEIGAKKSLVNYAFFIGAKPENLEFLENADYTRIPGIKLFMGATTGSSASDSDEFLNNLFKVSKAPVAVHAEDEAVIAGARRCVVEKYGENPPVHCHTEIRSAEACVSATEKITGLARKYGKRLHIMHVSTADELRFLDKGKSGEKLITAETCPQYLLFDSKDYERLGARIKCNPSIKTSEDRKKLIKATFDGTIDCIATDHAPHLLTDKEGDALKAASGMPGVQFSLPIMLELAEKEGYDASDVSRLMSSNPAEIWQIDRRGFIRQGYYADLVLIDRKNPEAITDRDVLSLCGWTPYIGKQVSYEVDITWVNGVKVYSRHTGVDRDSKGAKAVRFRMGEDK